MLAYDQPTDIAVRKPASRPAKPPSAMGLNVLDVVRLLWRRRILIVAAALLCAVVALTIGKSLTPKYTATAQLNVDPRELQLVDRELSPRSQEAANLPMIVESQARLFTSSSVLLRVVESAKLEDDPEFGGGRQSGLFGLLMKAVSLGGKPEDANGARTTALEALNRHINVKRTDRTFIVDVEVWSYDPVKAASLANAVASAYLAQVSEVQAASARRATSDLSGRLKELEQRLRAAENRVAAYRAENNFVGTQDNLVSDQQLSEVNARLGSARAATLDAQARYDQITASIRSSDDGGATSEALRSSTLAGLRTQYAEARRRQAELANELGPRHPAIRSMETQVADLKKNINEEVTRFMQSAKNDLTRARDYESGLVRALDGLKRQSLDMSQASVRLRELERDVEANRAVYQSFLKRSRETEEQESLNTSSARITGEANVPQRRNFPPGMSLLMMIGFIFGALASAVLVVIADLLKFAAAPVAAQVPEPVAESPVVAEQAQSRQPMPEIQSIAPKPALALMDKPLITRLRQSDVYRRNTDSPGQDSIDINRVGWPTLRIGGPPGAFAEAMREIRVAAARRSSSNHAPVLAMVNQAHGEGRSIAALNAALAAAHDGIDVLLVDVDFSHGELSQRLGTFGSFIALDDFQVSASGLGAPIETVNRVTVLPISKGADPAVMSEAVQVIVEHARTTTECGLIILDGPSSPFQTWDKTLLDFADGLLAVLPANLDINNAMEDILAALNGAERKLLGVVLNELDGSGTDELQEREYA
jgi:polysaccharide biosynthesis transport protein